MKGHCIECNKFYVRLDKHIKYKHGEPPQHYGGQMDAMDQDPQSIQSQEDSQEMTRGSWPFYFFLPENFLRRKDATRRADEREPIDIDWQSCQLAQFLQENDIKAWLKNSSNSFTLMSLARMINLMNNLHVSQPSCQAPLDIERSHQSARKNPKRMARFQSLFNEMEQVILRKMRPIFLKHADLIPDLLQHFHYK